MEIVFYILLLIKSVGAPLKYLKLKRYRSSVFGGVSFLAFEYVENMTTCDVLYYT